MPTEREVAEWPVGTEVHFDEGDVHWHMVKLSMRTTGRYGLNWGPAIDYPQFPHLNVGEASWDNSSITLYMGQSMGEDDSRHCYRYNGSVVFPTTLIEALEAYRAD